MNEAVVPESEAINCFQAAIKVNGHVYPTVEHYYQACKLYQLSGPKLASELRSIREAGQAKVISRKLLREAGVSLHKIEEWKYHEAPLLLHHALVHKFVQHSDLSDMLVQTGNAILAHSYDHENTFATGCGTHEVLDWAKRNSGRIIQVPVVFICHLL
ncbi:unnamed protein product [Toxocara canis]|uniref:DUF1768 domain-containing protein n=1 Tax=Toxocara canis TaxID=6265 RepID=A0A183U0A8_TOXCA|nr:unnamed protein product [Toxocara canis]